MANDIPDGVRVDPIFVIEATYAPDAESALAIARDDVYMKEGVWVEARVKGFGRVVREAEAVAQRP